MGDGGEAVAEQIWEVLVAADDDGVPAPDIMWALQTVQRRWMVENIDRVVGRPDAAADND